MPAFDVQRIKDVTHTGPGGCETAATKSSFKLRPLADRILVEVLPEVDDSVNGLFIPDVAKEKPQEGLVIAVGNGKVKDGERVPVDVRVGQKVLFGKYSGNECKVLGKLYLLLREDELMGCYEE